MKNNKVFIIVVILAAVLASTITAYATTYLYNSSEVSYDNTNSGLSATNVQGAISELYDNAIDYNSMNARLNSYFQNSPTSYFDGDWLRIKSTNAGQRGVAIYDTNDKYRGSFFSNNAETYIDVRDATQTVGTGTLVVRGSEIDLGTSTHPATVKINGSLLSGTYNLGAITSGTLASNYSSFISAHKNESALEGKFYITSSTAPSDIPAATNEWKYSYGVFRVRYVDPSGISDGHIILYGWGTNRTAMKYVTNNTISSTWQYITPTN